MLKKIDKYLNDISSKEKFYVYALTSVGVIFIVFYFIDPIVKQYQKEQLAQIDEVKYQISEKKSFLKFNTSVEIALFEQRLNKVENAVLGNKRYEGFVAYSLENLENIIYNREVWGKFLVDISAEAKEQNITITNITSKFLSSNREFTQVLNIKLEYLGNFVNNILFIDFLEKHNLIVDINEIFVLKQKDHNIETGLLKTSLNMVIWGLPQ
jgi:hypothetical protein